MKLAAGKILSVANAKGLPAEVVLYTAGKNVRVTYMQFVTEHSTVVTLNLFIVYKSEQVRIIKKDTQILADDLVLQLDVQYDLEEIERIVATANVSNVISYIITGEEL